MIGIAAAVIAVIVGVSLIGSLVGGNGTSSTGVGSGGAASSSGGSGKSLDDYNWEELSKISSEIGNASDESSAIEIAKKYGLATVNGGITSQTKSVALTDGTQAEVRIAGFAHDDKTGGGKAGITFIFTDCIGEHAMKSKDDNYGGWEGSKMRSWLNSEMINQLPPELQSVIVPVDKLTNNNGWPGAVVDVTKTSDSLWLFSAKELCGDVSWYSGDDARYNKVFNAEGSQYELFREMGVKSSGNNSSLVKQYNGSAIEWWERSPDPCYSNRFMGVTKAGNASGTDGPSRSYGVVPGFCI